MSRPKSSWGSIIAAGGATASALQLRKTKQHTKEILDLVSNDQFALERMHKEQLLATILASEKSSEIFVQKLNELNQNLSVSINSLSAEMRDISKANWSILNHLETRKAEREYEGKMFHLVTTVMEDLEDLVSISSEFPEYALVRANAWNEMFVSLKFGLEKFAQMEDSRKYDRARKVFSDLETLILSLSECTTKKDVKALDKSLATHQLSLHKVANLKTTIKNEKSRLRNVKKKLERHNKKRPRRPNLSSVDKSYQKDIEKANLSILECKDKVKHFKHYPKEIKELISESNTLLKANSKLHTKMRYHRKSRPWFSRPKRELWKKEWDEMEGEYNRKKSELNQIQNTIQRLCTENKIIYDREKNSISSSPHRKGMVTRWKNKQKSVEKDLQRLKNLEAQVEEHKEQSSELKKTIKQIGKNIEVSESNIILTELESKDALLESARFLPSAYLAME